MGRVQDDKMGCDAKLMGKHARRLLGLCLVVQNYVEERAMNLKAAVVMDET